MGRYNTVLLEIILAGPGIKFGGWAQNHHCKNISELNVGVQYSIAIHICEYELLADFNLVVARHLTNFSGYTVCYKIRQM